MAIFYVCSWVNVLQKLCIYMSFSMGVSFASLTDYTMNYTISLLNHNRPKNPPQIINFSIDSIFFVVERTNRHRNDSLYLSALRLLLDACLFKREAGKKWRKVDNSHSQSLNIENMEKQESSYLVGIYFFFFFFFF